MLAANPRNWTLAIERARWTMHSFCRICSGSCGMVLGIEDGRIAGIRGANVSLLINARRDCEAINAMPRMSAIPVRIESRQTL
jgi:hypothetical protein